MTPAAWYLRLPIIRHIRFLIVMYRINRHYEMYRMLGMLPVYADEDYEIVQRIRKGEL